MKNKFKITNENVLIEIKEILKRYEDPQCYLMSLLLASKFKGEIFYNGDHCLTLIDGFYYDKSGIVNIEATTSFLPLDDYGLDIVKTLMDALIIKHK